MVKEYKPKVTHEQLQNMVVELAQRKGFKCQYWWKSYHSPKGFLDLVLAKPSRLIFIELKVEPDKLSKEQQEWFDILKQIPFIEVYVIYYKDWDYLVNILSR
jgi:hypothetical protein